jgi:hypothetical protein
LSCDELLEKVLATAEADHLGADLKFRETVERLLFMAPAAQQKPHRYLERILKIIGPDATRDQFTALVCGKVGALYFSDGNPAATDHKLAAEETFPQPIPRCTPKIGCCCQ